MVTQNCPNCGHVNDISIYVSGQKTVCQFCGIRFTVRREESVPPAQRERPSAPPPDAPEIIGYDITGVIGEGGMGKIFRAVQRSLEREVAVKVLSERWAGNEVILKRFHREAAALAALSHPNIITIHDKGESRGKHYFIMEFIRGESLRDVINRGTITGETFVAYIIQICRGLEHAHAHGFVHRDLKPENLLLDENGNLKIADFGLTGLIDPDMSTDNMTRSRVAMGTFNYMAPEQRKDAKSVDHRADVYSMGVIMYEMLTGTLPIGNYTPASDINPRADRWCNAIIDRCLQLDPNARFQSARELKDGIRAAQKAPPPPVPVPTPDVLSMRRAQAAADATAMRRRPRKQQGAGFAFLRSRNAQVALIAAAGLFFLLNLLFLFRGGGEPAPAGAVQAAPSGELAPGKAPATGPGFKSGGKTAMKSGSGS